MVQEVVQPILAVWPDDKGVVHVTKPTEGFVGGPVELLILEVFHAELGDDQREW
jgi:hypothetical protein